MSYITELLKQANYVRGIANPDCWLFRLETARALCEHYDDKQGTFGKTHEFIALLGEDSLVLMNMRVHIVRNDLQFHAVLYYLAEVKGLKVAILTSERPEVTP